MCGIVGYAGKTNVIKNIMTGLKSLEYRGYDSSGIAYLDKNNNIKIYKKVGQIKNLDQILNYEDEASLGISHTRWATHGAPSDTNSHPHFNTNESIAVVHNGIIENYTELKEKLLKHGYTFYSQTDTEVVIKLVDYYYKKYNLGPIDAIAKTMVRVRGSYALELMFRDYPGEIWVARKDSPMIIGIADGETYVASDVPAILKYTRNVYYIGNLEFAKLTPGEAHFYNLDGDEIEKQTTEIKWDAEAAEKAGFEHFMMKEIHEQPKAVRDTMSQRIAKDGKSIVMDELKWDADYLNSFNKIYIVACGTAYHAGLVGKFYIEKLARTVVEVDVASEFRYREPIVDENTLFIAVSQSGETSDTLAAMKESKRLGAKTLALTNVVGSSIAREADQVLYTWAGPEIAVASTKAYTTQIVLFFMLALYMAEIKGTQKPERVAELIAMLKDIPNGIGNTLSDVEPIKTFAKQYGFNEDVFYIGRSLDYDVALEGSLKLKEISYIHAEAYAAGELKHGTLALIVEGVPVIALATQKSVYEKTLSNIKEVKARDAVVIGIASEGDEELEKYVDHVIRIPETDELLIPILAVVPLQLLAYYAAITRGCDVDKPRNLAKSVTVE